MADSLDPLDASLSSFETGQLSASLLAPLWRQAANERMPPLPARYLQVLEHLLSQMESAALFSEESCSFSQKDMADALRQWLSKARSL